MKKLAILLFVCAMVVMWVVPASAEIMPQYMRTEEFNVDVVVAEDNTLSITEEISVDFLTSRHGIYRYIPYILEFDHMVGDERYTKRMRAAITDVYVSGAEYAVETDGDFTLITIGDEDTYVRGQKTYTISYKMQIYDDGIEAADFLYLNLLPTEWETDIEYFSANVRFEKPLPEGVEPYVYAGKWGSADSDGVHFALSDSRDKMEIVATGKMLRGETATLDVLLPEGYFQGEARADKWILPAVVAAVIVAILAAWLYIAFGRDEKVIPVVNFYPPNGLSSAEIGHIIDGNTDQKDLISLIIYWAGKGYLEIHQDGKDFEFVKKNDLPRSAKSFEVVMFDGLFATGDIVHSRDLKNKFYTTMNAATMEMARYFSAIPENRIYTRMSTFARVISWLLCGLPLALVSLACLFAAAANMDALIISAAAAIIGSLAVCGISIALWDRRHTGTGGSFKSKAIAMGAVAIGLALLAVVIIGSMSGLIFPMALGAVCTLVSILFAVPTNKRTKENTRLLGEILGFKQFIEMAELDRLKALV
ncbi:MAG: DUF2207 domain-containing protein, partial [Clostridia bacterium]|nr:DUF2207 domain-containing protein [Clostridia bacterium]